MASCPRALSFATTFDPISPVPPITTIFIFDSSFCFSAKALETASYCFRYSLRLNNLLICDMNSYELSKRVEFRKRTHDFEIRCHKSIRSAVFIPQEKSNLWKEDRNEFPGTISRVSADFFSPNGSEVF